MNAAKTADGASVFKTRGLDGRSFILGCALFSSEIRKDTRVLREEGAPLRFVEHFKKMGTTTTGKHHPDGLFWVTSPVEQLGSGGVEHLPLTMVRTKLEQVMSSTMS